MIQTDTYYTVRNYEILKTFVHLIFKFELEKYFFGLTKMILVYMLESLPILQFLPITVFEIRVPVSIEEFSPTTTSCSSSEFLKENAES